MRADTNPPTSVSRILLLASAGLILMSLPLMIRLLDRLSYESTARAQVEVVAAQVKSKERELGNLREALAHARSDEYVEYWARVQMRMGKPGETIVIPSDGSGAIRPVTPWWQDYVR